MSRDWNSTATSSRLRAQREVISTSLPIGTNPQARNARSDAALPGDTWAHTRSPGAARRQGRRGSAPGRHRRCDRSRRAARPRARVDRRGRGRASPARGRRRTPAPRDGGRGRARRVGGHRDRSAREVDHRAGRSPRARRRANRSSHRARPPPQHVGVRATAEAVRPEGEQIGRRPVGEHVGVAGELDHRVRAVVVGRQHVDQAVGRRKRPAAAAVRIAASGCDDPGDTATTLGPNPIPTVLSASNGEGSRFDSRQVERSRVR